jgi:hypothetical protein
MNEQEARQTRTRKPISPSRSLKSFCAFEHIKRILCRWKQIQFEKQANYHTSVIKCTLLCNKTNTDKYRQIPTLHDLRSFKKFKNSNSDSFESRAEFFLAVMTAQRQEGSGRILLGDNTGSGAAMLRPNRFQCAGV